MKTVTQTLMGTTAEWGRTNPVLLEGMLGVEVRADGTRRVKIGDGKKNWLDPALKALGVEDVEGLSEELSDRLAAEAQAREREDDNLAASIADFIRLIEEKLGELRHAFPLMAEGGFYLITESECYLVFA